jgi:hypothetical protein
MQIGEGFAPTVQAGLDDDPNSSASVSAYNDCMAKRAPPPAPPGGGCNPWRDPNPDRSEDKATCSAEENAFVLQCNAKCPDGGK